jgi:hypothetical protein
MHEKGCHTGAIMTFTYSTLLAGLVGGTVTVCRNGDCHAGAVPPLPPQGMYVDMVFPDGKWISGSFGQDAANKVTLQFEWNEYGQVQDGDRYQVTLVDSTGASSTLLDKTAIYRKLAPNGEDCEPICYRADFQ